MSGLLLSRVGVEPRFGYDEGAWYWRVPAIAQLREEGLDLAPVTVLVGANGSGKSTVVEAVAAAWWSGFGDRALNTRSHGESFLAFIESRLTERGLWILDEPEAALSFRSCLRLALLDALRSQGSQVLLATHSPVLAALPGAAVLELGEAGMTTRSWAELELVRDRGDFMPPATVAPAPVLTTAPERPLS